MILATWNVNSLRMRLERVKAWLRTHQPDVLCLQETKCADANFPTAALEALGYHVAFAGQQNGLNGVALLSKTPLEDVVRELPGNAEDEQRRFISARTAGARVICVYVPNGKSVGSDDYFYKIDWLTRLLGHLRSEHSPEDSLIVTGDFNIAPDDRDVHDPAVWEGGLHCSPHERRMLGFLQDWGVQDALRVLHDDRGHFSWFDYRDTFKAFKADEGLRIDLVFATKPLIERLESVTVDLEERAGESPSDHAPVVATFS